MKIDLDFDFDYLRLYFRLDNMFTTWVILNGKCQHIATLILDIELSISNGDYSILNGRKIGFNFCNETEEIVISTWEKQYEFDIPQFLFVSKTKEYVDHFNWIKEAYVF